MLLWSILYLTSVSIQDIEKQAKGMDPLIRAYWTHSNVIATTFLTPFLICLIMIYGEQTLLLEMWDIRDVDIPYYFGFSLFMLVTNIFSIVILLNTVEVFYGWRVYAYLVYECYRFRSRSHRWVVTLMILYSYILSI